MKHTGESAAGDAPIVCDGPKVKKRKKGDDDKEECYQTKGKPKLFVWRSEEMLF